MRNRTGRVKKIAGVPPDARKCRKHKTYPSAPAAVTSHPNGQNPRAGARPAAIWSGTYTAIVPGTSTVNTMPRSQGNDVAPPGIVVATMIIHLHSTGADGLL